MSARDDNREDGPVRRLRVPAALAVAFVGTSAMVTMWYGGCDPNTPDPVPDAGRLEMQVDAPFPDDAGGLDDAGEPPLDANEPPH
jgi:hypothetical protein